MVIHASFKCGRQDDCTYLRKILTEMTAGRRSPVDNYVRADCPGGCETGGRYCARSSWPAPIKNGPRQSPRPGRQKQVGGKRPCPDQAGSSPAGAATATAAGCSSSPSALPL